MPKPSQGQDKKPKKNTKAISKKIYPEKEDVSQNVEIVRLRRTAVCQSVAIEYKESGPNHTLSVE